MRNESFTCLYCGKNVDKHPTGSARNHCPHCLCSLHVDANMPGDRLSDCLGRMFPIRMDYRKKKGDMILHRCEKCGKEILNKLAPDDEILDFVRKYHSREDTKNNQN